MTSWARFTEDMLDNAGPRLQMVSQTIQVGDGSEPAIQDHAILVRFFHPQSHEDDNIRTPHRRQCTQDLGPFFQVCPVQEELYQFPGRIRVPGKAIDPQAAAA
jgi:hypothetical protein